jgi:SPP1 family predicted phage head-tail adaptor
MDSGILRYWATYQTPVRSEDTYGDVVATHIDAFSIYISLDPIRANEVIKNRSEQMNATHKIRCRYSSLINSSGRFVYQGRSFDIFSVINPNNKNVELEILVNEVVKK